jgi:hypothetical protein
MGIHFYVLLLHVTPEISCEYSSVTDKSQTFSNPVYDGRACIVFVKVLLALYGNAWCTVKPIGTSVATLDYLAAQHCHNVTQ